MSFDPDRPASPDEAIVRDFGGGRRRLKLGPDARTFPVFDTCSPDISRRFLERVAEAHELPLESRVEKDGVVSYCLNEGGCQSVLWEMGQLIVTPEICFVGFGTVDPDVVCYFRLSRELAKGWIQDCGFKLPPELAHRFHRDQAPSIEESSTDVPVDLQPHPHAQSLDSRAVGLAYEAIDAGKPIIVKRIAKQLGVDSRRLYEPKCSGFQAMLENQREGREAAKRRRPKGWKDRKTGNVEATEKCADDE